MVSHALGGVKLQVLENNFEEAKMIIGQHLNGEFEEYLSEEFDNFKVMLCPQCGGIKIHSKASIFFKIMLVLTFGIFGIIYKTLNTSHQCELCKFKWKSFFKELKEDRFIFDLLSC